MEFTVASIKKTVASGENATQNVTVSGTTVAIVVALIGLVPPIVNTAVDWVKGTRSADIERELKVRTLEGDWIRTALAIEDDQKRADALQFLVKAKLVTHSGGDLATAAKSAPQFPSAGGTSMLGSDPPANPGAGSAKPSNPPPGK